jgi:hypothetical protein
LVTLDVDRARVRGRRIGNERQDACRQDELQPHGDDRDPAGPPPAACSLTAMVVEGAVAPDLPL